MSSVSPFFKGAPDFVYKTDTFENFNSNERDSIAEQVAKAATQFFPGEKW